MCDVSVFFQWLVPTTSPIGHEGDCLEVVRVGVGRKDRIVDLGDISYVGVHLTDTIGNFVLSCQAFPEAAQQDAERRNVLIGEGFHERGRDAFLAITEGDGGSGIAAGVTLEGRLDSLDGETAADPLEGFVLVVDFIVVVPDVDDVSGVDHFLEAGVLRLQGGRLGPESVDLGHEHRDGFGLCFVTDDILG